MMPVRKEGLRRMIESRMAEPKLTIRQSHIYMRFYVECTECGFKSDPTSGNTAEDIFLIHKRKHDTEPRWVPD